MTEILLPRLNLTIGPRIHVHQLSVSTWILLRQTLLLGMLGHLLRQHCYNDINSQFLVGHKLPPLLSNLESY